MVILLRVVHRTKGTPVARLPIPGSDNGSWGTILNDYLLQTHKGDGTLKDNAVTANTLASNSVTNAAIASDAVNAASIADGSITEQLLDTNVQAKLNANGGDASTNTAASVDGEVAVFSGTAGKTLKRATGSGVAKLNSGVLGTATAGTDYAPATSGSQVLKGDNSGGTTAAVPGVDFVAPGVTSNFKLSNTTKLRASLAKAIAGTGYSTHVIAGDSLSSAFNGNVFDFAGSWWRRLWRGLVAAGVPSAGTGRVAITDYDASGDAGHPVGPIDPRISVSGAWTATSTWLGSPAAGGTVTFTSDVVGTAVDVYYKADGANPDFTITIDGGSPQIISQSGPWRREKASFTGLTDTTHTVVVTAAAGSQDDVVVTGFRVRKASGLQFDNFGVKYGISANYWYASPDDLGPRGLSADYSSDADVVWIALGSNDFFDAGYSAGVTAMGNIRALWPSADCILVIPPNVDDHPDYSAYIEAMRVLSTSLDVPLIDLSLRYGSAKADVAAAQLLGADGVHLNAVGQSDWAAVALDAAQSVGPRFIS